MLYLSMSDCVGAVITCAARAGGYPEASVPGSPSRSSSHFVREGSWEMLSVWRYSGSSYCTAGRCVT